MKSNKTHNIAGSRPKLQSFVPIAELEKTLEFLNSNEKRSTQNYCRTTTPKFSDMAHMTNMHYCYLIKHAILKHNWRHVMKLLLAYIDEPRVEKYTTGIIFRYSLIYFLNDPVAQSLEVFNEFLQLALSCQTETDKKEFLRLLMTFPCNKKEEPC